MTQNPPLSAPDTEKQLKEILGHDDWMYTDKPERILALIAAILKHYRSLEEVERAIGEDELIFVDGKQVQKGSPMMIDLSGGVDDPRFRQSCKNIQDNGRNMVRAEIRRELRL